MSVFISIWTKIRATVRDMIDHRSLAFAIMLYAIGGIGSMMMGLTDSKLETSVFILLLMCLILGPIVLLVIQLLVVGVTLLFGKLFKGTATFKQLYKALSLGYIPFIVLIPFYTIWLASEPESLLNPEVDPTGAIPSITLLLTFVMSIYCLIIQLVAVSEAHRFSKWKAFFTLLIPGFLLFAILFVAILAITAFIVGLTAI